MDKAEKTVSSAERFIDMEGINRFSERLAMAMGNMTNVELATLCGLSEATVRNYRKGKNFPPLDKLALIAKACNCSLEWLVTGKNEDKCGKIEKNCDSGSSIDQALSSLSPQEKQLILTFIRREGTNNLVRLAAMNTSTISQDAVESIIDALPLRPVLKNAIKIGMAGSEETDKEILRVIEKYNSSNNATQELGAVTVKKNVVG
ncbi:helix-turn-helix domain-containing protein [Escherichia coli]